MRDLKVISCQYITLYVQGSVNTLIEAAFIYHSGFYLRIAGDDDQFLAQAPSAYAHSLVISVPKSERPNMT